MKEPEKVLSNEVRQDGARKEDAASKDARTEAPVQTKPVDGASVGQTRSEQDARATEKGRSPNATKAGADARAVTSKDAPAQQSAAPGSTGSTSSTATTQPGNEGRPGNAEVAKDGKPKEGTGLWTRFTNCVRSPALRRGALALGFLGTLLLPAWQPMLTPVGWLAFVLLLIASVRAIRSKQGVLLTALGSLLAYPTVALIGVLGVLPALHSVTTFAWQWLPILVVLLFAGGLSALLSHFFNPERRGRRLVAVWSVAALLIGFLVYANTSTWFIEWQLRAALEPEDLPRLPVTINDRLVPRQTAREFIQNANRDNRLNVPTPHLVLANGNLWWQSALPFKEEVTYGSFFGSVSRVIRMGADTTGMKPDTKSGDNAFFLFGEDSWVVDRIFKVRHPFSTPAEVVYWRKDSGDWVMLISYTSLRPTWTGTMVPYLAGVMEVSGRGWVTDHGVQEAAKLFPGAPFYPTSLARKYAEAYGRWRGGLMESNSFVQRGILRISEASNPDPNANRFPYLQHIKDLGLQEVVQFQPNGSSSYTLVEVLYFDAGTGKARRFVVPENTTLNAAQRAIENVRKADPNNDWSHRRELEPRLVVTESGKVYQLISVVQDLPDNPHNYAYIMEVLVAASNLDAWRIDNLQQLEAFLKKHEHAPAQSLPASPAVAPPAVSQPPGVQPPAPAPQTAPMPPATAPGNSAAPKQ